jgi:hypothetical protein
VQNSNFAEDDMQWIGALSNVSNVTMENKCVKVKTDNEDAVPAIVDSITKRYCNSATPKLNALFCVYVHPTPKHKP